MRMTPLAIAALAFAALTLTACASPGLGVHTGPGDPELLPPGAPTVPGGPEHIPATSNIGRRYVCRAAPTTRGWIATDYVMAERECPRTSGDQGYNGAVMEYYENRPLGTVMAVCADEVTPNGWIREHTVPEQVCTGARVDDGEPTAKLIRRVR